MRVLVIGGSGFTGGSVVSTLRQRGHEVFGLARSKSAAVALADLGARPVAADLDDPRSIDAAFASVRPDALVNVASLGFGHAPPIIAATEEAGIRRAVFVSTTAIYTSLDAASKAVRTGAEAAIAASALDWTIVRPTMIYGSPRDRNIWRVLQALRRSPIVPLPDGGNRLQQPIHVDDLAEAIVTAVENPHAIGRAYDVGGPEPLPFRDIMEQAARAVGRDPLFVPVPAGPIIGILRVFERVGWAGPLKAEQIERLLEDKAFDIGDACRELAVTPRPFYVGIAQEAALGHTAYLPWEKAGVYARTVAHLPAGQLASRVRLRAKKAALARRPTWFEGRWQRRTTASSWPSKFEPIDKAVATGCPSVEQNAAGVFEFFGSRHDLGQPIHWRPGSATQLWRYHLHYWEWAWAFDQHPDRGWARHAFADLWRNWKAGTAFGRWDEWSPYVVSLRAWVMCNLFGALVAGTDLEESFVDDLALHAGFVAANLELDVGGNHLVKNLKAAVALGVFLGDDELVDLGRRGLEQQLRTQVLPDGGHFELSPSYHAQVLGDFVDVATLLEAAERPPVAGLDKAIEAMRAWLAALLLPDGDVPRLGDSWPVGASRLRALGVEPTEGERLRVLRESGYVVVRPDERLHAVLDVGRPCPPQLPAHAQADCLSFVLSIDGIPVVVDPGITTYEAGGQRAFERSTHAHNTVAIDATDQTEVWGQFRAGRLASPVLEAAEDDGAVIEVAGTHDGYDRLPGGPRHRRTWRFVAGTVVVHDRVEGCGRHLLSSRWLLKGVDFADKGRSQPSMTVALDKGSTCALDVRNEGRIDDNEVVAVRLYGELPCSWTVTFRAR